MRLPFVFLRVPSSCYSLCPNVGTQGVCYLANRQRPLPIFGDEGVAVFRKINPQGLRKHDGRFHAA